jgi:hypothetical protein
MAADIQVTPGGVTGGEGSNISFAHPNVWVSKLVGYVFYLQTSGTSGIYYVKTTDGGLTWSAAVKVNPEAGNIICKGASLWFDKWTPGDTGTKIHINWGDQTDQNVFFGTAYYYYRSLDTATDTLSAAPVLIVSSVNGGGLSGGPPTITKARNGYLYDLVWHGPLGGTSHFMRSIDNGVTWTARDITGISFYAPVGSARLFPGNNADAADVYMVKVEPLSDLNLGWYDNSLDAWTFTLIDGTVSLQNTLDATTRASDNHSFVAYLNAASDTLQVIEVTGDTTFIAKTNVFTAEAGHIANPSVGIALDANSNLIAVYAGQGGLNGRVGAKKSKDGSAWTAEIRVDAGTFANEGQGTTAPILPFNTGPFFATWNAAGPIVAGNLGLFPLFTGGSNIPHRLVSGGYI